MAAVSVTTSISLRPRKRKRTDSLVLHLSSPSPSCEYDTNYTESEYDDGQSLDAQLDSTEHAPTSKANRYPCAYAGCTKSYAKPSRLAEHERSHSGERPYVCPTCNKSYLRETHLHAHTRTHLPSSAKPFACDEPGCGKRFWTTQHLRVHGEQHRGEKPFKCTEPSCTAAFSKNHQLRDHVCTVHAPEGTKPYRCDHPGCTKSFATNQKLMAHSKTHDDKRYTCVHQDCKPAMGMAATYYPTWSALQHHTRTAHPPTCPHASCKGKTFTAHKGLRAHLKIHAQRDAEVGMERPEDGDDEDDERPRKKRRGGEVGREWVCEVEGCDKDFKSKKALTTHHNVFHLGRRDFACPHEGCERAFGYKHLLQRHMSRLHANPATSDSDSDTSLDDDTAGTDVPGPVSGIDVITGSSYAAQSREMVHQAKRLQCPFPDVPASFLSEAGALPPGPSAPCPYSFSRGYDLQRHLRAEHRLEVTKEVVARWVQNAKQAKLGSQASAGSMGGLHDSML